MRSTLLRKGWLGEIGRLFASLRRCQPTALLAAFAIVCGCAGGSGSGGFDIAAENAAIDQALETKECIDFKGLQICAAATATQTPPVGTPTAQATPVSPPPTPAATPTRSPQGAPNVSIEQPGIPASDSLTCNLTESQGCLLPFAFEVTQPPPGSAVYVAYRNLPLPAVWTILPASSAAAGASSVFYTVTIAVPGSVASAGSTTSIQIAILIYPEPPSSVPASVEELIDAGPDFAFVSAPLTVTAD